MKDEKITQKALKNAEGKRLLEQTKLEYSQLIINELKTNPQIYQSLLEELEIKNDDFLNCLSGETKANISLYDQALVLVRKKTNKHNK